MSVTVRISLHSGGEHRIRTSPATWERIVNGYEPDFVVSTDGVPRDHIGPRSFRLGDIAEWTIEEDQ